MGRLVTVIAGSRCSDSRSSEGWWCWRRTPNGKDYRENCTCTNPDFVSRNVSFFLQIFVLGLETWIINSCVFPRNLGATDTFSFTQILLFQFICFLPSFLNSKLTSFSNIKKSIPRFELIEQNLCLRRTSQSFADTSNTTSLFQKCWNLPKFFSKSLTGDNKVDCKVEWLQRINTLGLVYLYNGWQSWFLEIRRMVYVTSAVCSQSVAFSSTVLLIQAKMYWKELIHTCIFK